MQSAFRFTLLVSLLVHLLVIVPLWLLSDDKQPAPSPKQTQTIEVALQAKEQPKPVAPEPQLEKQTPTPPPPRHLEDDITKANTTNGVAEEPLKGKSKAKPTELPVKEAKAITEQTAQQQKQIAEETTPPPVVRSNRILLSEHLKKQQQQKESNVGHHQQNAFTAEAQERARWYNEVLKRITEQVKLVWVVPQNSQPYHKGLILLTLNENGYLEKAWIKVPSGDVQLDQSALRALHQVYRYDIPYDKAMFEYYKVLSFNYHGGVNQ